MNSITHERKASLLLKLIGDAFYELQDFDTTNVAINDVTLTNDGSYAKVYVTFFKDKERYLEKVTRMTPFIRSVVARNWHYKKLPELKFNIDTVEPEAARIEKILDNLKK